MGRINGDSTREKMAEDMTPDSAQFKQMDKDVTCCCEYLCCGNSHLSMEPEEVEYRKTTCFVCNYKKRGPYGELGTVDSSQTCCFYGFAAGSLMKQEGEIQCIGLGCDKAAVDEIVSELKLRQKFRGDRAKMRVAETTLHSLTELHTKIDAVMDHLQIKAPKAAEMDRATAPSG